jgi:hypothetical protein
MQRHAMLMYTSCGWFFDDISGIETVQIIEYAGEWSFSWRRRSSAPTRLVWRRVSSNCCEAAKSNVPDQKDGGEIYLRQVKKAQVGFEEVAAHYAISSVFTSYPEETRLFGYSVQRLDAESLNTGRTQLLIGRAMVRSLVTGRAGAGLVCSAALRRPEHQCRGQALGGY